MLEPQTRDTFSESCNSCKYLDAALLVFGVMVPVTRSDVVYFDVVTQFYKYFHFFLHKISLNTCIDLEVSKLGLYFIYVE